MIRAVAALLFGFSPAVVAAQSGPIARTLTLTAVSLSFHTGDPVPPLIFSASGLSANETFATATQSGRPQLSTTATAASTAGVYPIRIAAGSTTASGYTLKLVPGTMTVLPADSSGARTNSYAYPEDAMVSVKKFGAVGDGKTDDTAAINRAITEGRTPCNGDFYRSPKILYFPPGRYLLTGQLSFCGAEMSLRGAGPTQSVLYLAPRTPAFNAKAPLPLLNFPSAATTHSYGNISFRNFISALGVDIGEGNDNAVGIDAVMNNVGSIEDVIVTDEEAGSPVGINFIHAWNGPMLVKNVAVYGFKNGYVLGHDQYSSVYSHITVEGQSTNGFLDAAGQAAAIEQMYSCNRVPAIANTGAHIAVINSTFDCGAPNATAYLGSPRSSQHLRNIHVHGYGKSLDDKAQAAPATRTGDIAEYVTGTPASAFARSANPASLNLPIRETPVAHDPKPSTWIALSPTDPSRWSAQLHTCSSSTAYLPGAQYTIAATNTPVDVPACIHHLQLFNAGFNPSRVSVTFVINGAATDPPLVIENLGTNFAIAHNSARPLVLRHAGVDYTSTSNAGTLFLEDFGSAKIRFQPGQHIWARQYDNETADPPQTPHCAVATVSTTSCFPPAGVKVVCAGCTLWILGPKTEKGATNFQLSRNARMELFGGFFLPLQPNQQPASTVIESTDSSFSADFMQYLYPNGKMNTGTAHIVTDTQHGTTHYVDPQDQNTTFRTGLVYSNGASGPPK